jgi:TonB family protein
VPEAVLTADLDRERVFRRAVGISAAAHAALLLLAVVSPFPRSRPAALPGVVSVSLVAAAPAAPAPAAKAAPPKPPAAAPKPKPPEAKPAPPPEPPPPEVKADKKLLPKDPTQAPKPKPKPAVAPPKPAPPPKPMDYDAALDTLRQELGEEPPSDAPDPDLVASVQPAAPTGPPGGAGGDPLDPAVAEWMRRVKIHVSRSWILEASEKRKAIQALLNVTLDATGNVIEVELRERSGSPSFDTSVVRAIEKASPLPPPPDSGEWPFIFTPQDVL